MNNQQNGRVILWLTWQKYETMYQLLTCTFRRFQKHSNDNGYGDRFTGTIARDNYIMNQIDPTENPNQNGLKSASDIQGYYNTGWFNPDIRSLLILSTNNI